MTERFTSELDRYEREMALRVGTHVAADARREMALHLQADYDARIEIGFEPEKAQRATLEAIGNLEAVAREERSSPLLASSAGWSEGVVLTTGLSLQGGWTVPGLMEGSLRLVLYPVAALTLLGVGIVNARSDRRTYGWPIWVVSAILPLLVVCMFFPPTSPESNTLMLAQVGLSVVGAFTLGAVRRRAIWRLGLVVGAALFLTQMLVLAVWRPTWDLYAEGLILVLAKTWLVLTLPILFFSALGAGAATLMDRSLALVRRVAR